MVNAYHKHKIQHRERRQKSRGEKARLRAVLEGGRIVFLALLLPIAGCDPVQVIEGSDTHVSIRYDGIMNGLDKATQLARSACAQHGKTAKLRRTYQEGLGVGERFAFFDCV